MASRKGDLGGGEKQGSIEIAYVRLNGGDSTLQEAVKAFSTLIARSSNGNALTGAKRVNALTTGTKAANNGKDAAVIDDNALDVESVEDADEPPETTTPTAPRAPRKYSMPTAIPIDTESGVSVETYVAQFKLENDQDRYVALAGWLKTHREDVPLKAGLVLTLYDRLGWKKQADLTMPLRRNASKQFQWLEVRARGEYHITHMGENRLAKLKM